MRNQAGITEQSPAGTDEVVYYNDTKTQGGGDVIWDAASTGKVSYSSMGMSGKN